ncbi:zinc/iron regulated transporter-related protein 48C isoform X3 [Rhodnius prolixus]|uniref:zinc/iron regulated transporter-related protein 48C isoform X3 n=1 Tax=Rhodnius prolixus TaxID=13249 RepID=UPI003D18C70A
MIKEYRPLVQALLGTFFTWALTAAGALMVIFFKGTQPKLLDSSLGFAAGVMTAASYWSLLAPAIEMAKESEAYGEDGRLAFIPACVGFLLGAAFTFAADILISKMGIESPTLLLAIYDKNNKKNDYFHRHRSESSIFIEPISEVTDSVEDGNVGTTVTRRRPHTTNRHPKPAIPTHDARLQWKRILLLIIAITVHNIPEGLAVGVGFGAIGSSTSATFHNARYGQLSGMVEPLFGLIGVLLVTAAQPVLPYALAFAAGAMIYVVVDDIIPEANTKGNGCLASWGAIFGFMVMMMLEVGLQ